MKIFILTKGGLASDMKSMMSLHARPEEVAELMTSRNPSECYDAEAASTWPNKKAVIKPTKEAITESLINGVVVQIIFSSQVWTATGLDVNP